MAELLAELVAKITADATELKKALGESEKDVEGLGKTTDRETRSITQSLKEVGKAFVVVGGSITAAMTGAIMSFTKTGSELHDLSLKTGVSVKALAGLKYAAEQNGASLGTVEMAIRRTASALTDAKDGLETSKRAFDKMGLSIKDLEGLNVEQQFLMIANAIANIPDPMTRAAVAVDLFGRSGTDMLPMLSEGAEGLRKIMEEGVKFSGWTTEGAALADTFGDSLGTLKTSMSGLANTIGASLAPILTDLANKITNIVSGLRAWAQEHPELAKGISEFSLGIGILLTGLGTLFLLLPQIIASYKAFIVVINAARIASIGFVSSLYGPLGLIVGLGALGVGLIYTASRWADYNNIVSDTVTQSKKFSVNTPEALAALQSMANKSAAAKSSIKDANTGLSLFTETTKASKVAIAEASWELGGFKYQTQLFSEEEIKAAENVGALVTKIDPELTKALQQAEDGMRSAKEEAGRLTTKFWDMMNQIYYADSAAGKMNITMFNIYDAMDELGYSVKDIRDAFNLWGMDIASVKVALEALGLTAEEVNKILRETELPIYTVGGGGISPWVPPGHYQTYDEFKAFAPEAVITEEAYNADIARRKELYGFQHGGIITQPTMALLGEQAPAIREAVISETDWGEIGGKSNVTINFTQPVFFDREDTMNKFVNMIRKGIQRQDRIRFGGAYNG